MDFFLFLKHSIEMRWGETFRYLILAELSSGYGDENLDRHKVYKKTKDSLIYIPNTSNSVVRFLWKESQVREERKLKYFQA